MKRMIVAAGALLMGTSALAYASVDKSAIEPAAVSSDVKVSDNSLLSDWDKARVDTWEKTFADSKTDMTASSDSKLDLASLDKDLAPVASQEAGAKFMTASAETGLESTGKLETASNETSSDKVITASVDDTTDKVETAMVDKSSYVGTGGPLEEVDATASAPGAVVQPSNADPELDARGIAVISDAAFVPLGYNGTGGAGGPIESGDNESYSACTRERTDNCIQLYERGVIAQADNGKDATAVGGPYEPVADDGAEFGVNADTSSAMNGDGTVDTAPGETSDSSIQAADASVADHSAYQGIGGPVEAQSGYPPCSPGPGDDRCIQLYERGVTGAGN